MIREVKERFKRGLYLSGPELYLSNLPSSIDDKQLLKLVEDKIGVGKVRRCKVIHDSHGHSRCYGFLTFYDLSDCISGIRALLNKEIGGKILRILPSRYPPHKRGSSSDHTVARSQVGEDSTRTKTQSSPRYLNGSSGPSTENNLENNSLELSDRFLS